MIPWCFAYDHINYARYLSAYLFEMTHLKEALPDAYEYLKTGGFSVQISDHNPFGRVPLEQDTQTAGGPKASVLKQEKLANII